MIFSLFEMTIRMAPIEVPHYRTDDRAPGPNGGF